MRKIYISAGHSNKEGRDMGASGNGYIEGKLTVEFRDLIVKELKNIGVTPIVDGNNSIFSETINYFRNLVDSKAIVLDLHWNAATPQAKGTETIVPAEPTKFEVSLAEALSKEVSDLLGIPLRGKNGVRTEKETHHGRLAWMRLTGENVLMEVCFISNKKEMEAYQSKKEQLAKNIAKVLKEFASNGETTVVKEHVVQKGDSLTKIAAQYKTTVTKLQTDNKIQGSTIYIGQKLKL